MCGIAGFWLDQPELDRVQMEGRLLPMMDALRHRGPDGEGTWVDVPCGLGLGHRRLKIMDLGPSAHQPRTSPSGDFVLCYNGEIYNFRSLRGELEAAGLAFEGQGDAEVVAAALDHWGVEKALTKFDGMFAMAIWQRSCQRLILARDRMGEKPLCYGRVGRDLVFASELRALRRYPGYQQGVNHRALLLYLRFGCVPSPHCIEEGVVKVEPGTGVEVLADGNIRSFRYWSVRSRALQTSVGAGDPQETLHSLLKESVRARLQAAVPFGIFLSGGIDSTLVAALAQSQSSHPLKTFTIGFEHTHYDEAPYSRAVARYLGCDHQEHYLDGRQAAQKVLQLADIYDEPFADSSQIATSFVADLAKTQVQGVLTGDGSDELFLGYSRYAIALRQWKVQCQQRTPSRRLAFWFFRLMANMLERSGLTQRNVFFRIRRRLLSWLPSDPPVTLEQIYRNQTTLGYLAPGEVLSQELQEDSPFYHQPSGQLELGRCLSIWDLEHYLPNDILTKVDRATMAASLEARAPFLAQALVEYALDLPADVDGGKAILKRILSGYLPPSLFERPKQGFMVPLGDWLRGPFRAWAQELLHPDRLRRQGFFRAEVVSRLWKEHLQGVPHDHQIWVILMFQQWLDHRQR